jgi:protein-disulfide isomerase
MTPMRAAASRARSRRAATDTPRRAAAGPRSQARARAGLLRCAASAAIAIAAAVPAGKPAAAQTTTPHPGTTAAGQPAPGHAKGRADAPVIVLEFADFACGECARFAAETLPAILNEYVAAGLVQFRFVPFNLGVFRPGAVAARAAECAARQDAFWPMHDVLYARQREWLARGGQRDRFRRWAVELGLDLPRFDACLDDDTIRERLDANTDTARARGVRATPTFWIGDAVLVGAAAADRFREALDAAIAAAAR